MVNEDCTSYTFWQGKRGLDHTITMYNIPSKMMETTEIAINLDVSFNFWFLAVVKKPMQSL